MREAEPLAFLITSAYAWGIDDPRASAPPPSPQDEAAAPMGQEGVDGWGFGGGAAMPVHARPLVLPPAPPFECGTYARGRMPSFKCVVCAHGMGWGGWSALGWSIDRLGLGPHIPPPLLLPSTR